MLTSKTIKTIEKFYNILGLDRDPTSEEKEYVYNFELELAKSMLNEFDSDTIRKLATILLVEVE